VLSWPYLTPRMAIRCEVVDLGHGGTTRCPCGSAGMPHIGSDAKRGVIWSDSRHLKLWLHEDGKCRGVCQGDRRSRSKSGSQPSARSWRLGTVWSASILPHSAIGQGVAVARQRSDMGSLPRLLMHQDTPDTMGGLRASMRKRRRGTKSTLL